MEPPGTFIDIVAAFRVDGHHARTTGLCQTTATTGVHLAGRCLCRSSERAFNVNVGAVAATGLFAALRTPVGLGRSMAWLHTWVALVDLALLQMLRGLYNLYYAKVHCGTVTVFPTYSILPSILWPSMSEHYCLKRTSHSNI